MARIDEKTVISIPVRSGVLPQYTDDSAFVTGKGSAAAEGDVYWNTTDKGFRRYDGTAWGRLLSDIVIPGATEAVSGGGDALKNKIAEYEDKILIGKVTINAAAATYNVPEIKNLITADENFFDVAGDTRELAGLMFIDGTTPLYYDAYGLTKAGKGSSNSDTIQIVDGNDGADYVQVSWTNQTNAPDFSDFGSGDKLIVKGSNNVFTELTISSVSGNKIYTTTTPPSLGTKGDSLVMVPNRIISGSGGTTLDVLGNQSRVRLRGFAFEGFDNINVGLADYNPISTETDQLDGGIIKILNCLFKHTGLINYNGLCLIHASSMTGISGNTDVTLDVGNENMVQGKALTRCAAFGMSGADFEVNCDEGGELYVTQSAFTGYGGFDIYKNGNSSIVSSEIFEVSISSAYAGIDVRYGGLAFVNYLTVEEVVNSGNAYGFYAAMGGRICDKDQVTAINCDRGAFANNGGFIAIHPSGFSGNTTDYDPSTSGSVDNNGSLLVRQ